MEMMSDEREVLFAHECCESVEKVELVVSAAHKLLFFSPLMSSIKGHEHFSTMKGRSSSSIIPRPTESANFPRA